MNNGKVTPCRKTAPCGCKKNCSVIPKGSHLFGLVGRILVQRRRARNGSRGNRSFTYTYKVFQYYSCMNSSNVTILSLIFHR